MAAGEISLFLFSVAVLLLFARVFGELLRAVRQPAVIGEILAGIVLGPTMLGSLFPQFLNGIYKHSVTLPYAFEGITTLAVVMLLLVSGLEVDISLMLKQGKVAASTGLLGIIIPFSLGFAAAMVFPETLGFSAGSSKTIYALFVGTALSITALPVVARTLMDLGIFRSHIGFIIIASAMFNDLIGWLIFSLLLAAISPQPAMALQIGSTITLTLLFTVLTLVFGRKLINAVIPFIQEKLTYPGSILSFILILGFFAAAFTEYIGIHAIFGAFIIGIAIGDSARLKEETREMIQHFITNIFAPLFFVSIGLKVNFVANFDLLLVSIFLLLAFAGKVIGGGLGARLGGLSGDESLAIGFGMNSRGAMEIILGILALKSGLINDRVFVALVIVALVTSITSAPFMSYFLRRSKRLESVWPLLKKEHVFFSAAISHQELFAEFAGRAASTLGIPRQQIVPALLERESSFPTGIGSRVAIPHARMKVKRPFIAVAVLQHPLDFSAPDGLPCSLVFCLITPEGKNQMQLNFLSEIAGFVQDENQLEQALGSTDAGVLYAVLSAAKQA